MRPEWLMFLTLLVYADGQADIVRLPEMLRKAVETGVMLARKISQDVLGPTGSSPRHLAEATKQRKVQEAVNSSMAFPCDLSEARSPHAPASVHRLRPGDIDVVGALGDSITAGFGATALNHLQVLRENRGLSMVGGQGTWRRFLTMPNILKMYNPRLFGFSLGDAVSFEWPAQFNVAEGTAKTSDMPFMAKHLMRRMANDPRVDMANHWKLVTLLIGGNDYCQEICFTDGRRYLEKRRRDLIETLDLLRDNLPRTLVMLIVSPNVVDIMPSLEVPALCWISMRVVCPCLLGSRFSDKRSYYKQIVFESQRIELEVAGMTRYKRDDFAVVAQTFLMNMSLPQLPDGRIDMSYLSADCFHLSQKGNARGGNALWNNMLQPVGGKDTDWDTEYNNIRCTSHLKPYIFTAENSSPLSHLASPASHLP